MNIQADQPQHSAAAPDNQPALDATIARGSWGLAIRGTLGILLGFIIISAPAEDTMPLAVLATAFMLFEAVFVVALVMLRMAHAQDRHAFVSRDGVTVLSVSAVALILALMVPAVPVLPMLAGWSMVSGVLILITARRHLVTTASWWLALGALAATAHGALLLCAAMIDRFAFTLWLGAYTVIFGASVVLLAIRLRLSFGTSAHDLATPHGASRG